LGGMRCVKERPGEANSRTSGRAPWGRRGEKKKGKEGGGPVRLIFRRDGVTVLAEKPGVRRQN